MDKINRLSRFRVDVIFGVVSLICYKFIDLISEERISLNEIREFIFYGIVYSMKFVFVLIFFDFF